MTLDNYYDLLNSEYFTICKNKTVLEIGPFEGHHTRHIVAAGPGHLETIEFNFDTKEKLSAIVGIDNAIYDDALIVLQKHKPVDIVVCFGVLYHLHNSLELLELFANNCNPEYVMLDSTRFGGKYDPTPDVQNSGLAYYSPEIDNRPGNRHTKSGWKSAKINVVLPKEAINLAMTNLGYTQIKYHEPYVQGWVAKSNVWLGLWKRNNL